MIAEARARAVPGALVFGAIAAYFVVSLATEIAIALVPSLAGARFVAPWILALILAPPLTLLAGRRAAVRLPDIAARRLAWGSAIVVAVGTAQLFIGPHRRFAVLLALVEIGVVAAFDRRRRSPTRYAALAGVILVSWAFTAGFPYTPLSEWMIGATQGSALAIPAFLLALALAVANLLGSDRARRFRVHPAIAWGAAVVLFLALGLRGDHETQFVIPYVQSMWTAPAALVREHHWLLWDVPSHAGFLAVLALAAMPGATTFDAFHIFTALVLGAEGLMVFAIMIRLRRGVVATISALAFVGAAFFGSQANFYPSGPRLYPQEAVTSLWPIVIVYLAFARSRAVAARTRRWYLVGGYAAWLCGLFWSAESAVVTSVAWAGYLIADACAPGPRNISLVTALRRLRRYAGTCAGLLVVSAIVTEIVYFVHFGSGPDLRMLAPLWAADAFSPVRHAALAIDGAFWTAIIAFIALSVAAALALRRHTSRTLPLVVATWLAIWASAARAVLEGNELHARSLTVMIALGVAVAFFVTERRRNAPAALLVRLLFVPFIVVVVGYALAAPLRVRAAIIGTVSPDPLRISQSLPTVAGELEELERRAGIDDRDAVVYPAVPNAEKLDAGLVVPLERGADGRVYERRAWLPVSPSAERDAFEALPFDEQSTVVERFLTLSGSARGWYITYRRAADCRQLAPNLVSTRGVDSPNFRVVFCDRR